MSRFGWSRGKKVGSRRTNALTRTSAIGRPRLALEPLEERTVLSVSLNTITGPDAGGVYDVPSGKDLYVPLVGTDTGQTISYTATSSNPLVTATVLAGNPTLEMTVHGTTAGGQTFSGTMTFQLFENIAPQTVQGIIDQVNAGLYNGASFYRMETASTFELIQGGIEQTPSKSDSTILPDEFNVAATFNSSGLLAMANAGPGTATSEFFITGPNRPLADDPQSLNYGYTIFGQILTGLDIYNDILNVPTTSNSGIDFANTPVTIDSASIITDTQNGVLQISEPNDFAGSSTITVTGTGTDSTTAQQTFNVNVAAPSASAQNTGPLFLSPIINQTTDAGTPVSFQITATDAQGNTPTFTVTGNDTFTGAPANVTVQVTPGSDGTATVILTPAAGFSGVINLVAHADDASSAL
ncbi:MAG TPA: peptidylprolyl isomerase, partial [Pirellulales bacterium]|nr:peptidylprolyl isomerase [Pirellulales bacterium]